MQNLELNVTEIEALQMTNNIAELDRIFIKAKTAVVNGGAVILYRQTAQAPAAKFDEITTEADLTTYKENVYKYLK